MGEPAKQELTDRFASRPPTARSALLRSLRPALPAISLYYAAQAIGIAVLVVLSSRAGMSAVEQLGAWDGAWFLSVAEHGYDQPLVLEDGRPRPNNLAFFPLYPALTSAVMALGVPKLAAALLVTFLSGGVLAWGLYTLGAELAGPKTGTLLAGLVGMAPGSGVLHMAYSEALFLAIAVWVLIAVVRERWILASVLTCVAGLTRVTAIALIAALAVAAIIATMRGRGGWRPLLAAALAPAGLLSYLVYVGWRTGRIDGYYWLQADGWGVAFDGGAFTWERFTTGLTRDPETWITLVSLCVLAGLALLIWSYTTPLPPAMYVYTTVVVVLALTGSEHWQSRPRFLLPAIALAIPLAMGMARLKRHELAIVLSAGALAGGWFGAYLLVVAQVYP